MTIHQHHQVTIDKPGDHNHDRLATVQWLLPANWFWVKPLDRAATPYHATELVAVEEEEEGDGITQIM